MKRLEEFKSIQFNLTANTLLEQNQIAADFKKFTQNSSMRG